MQPTSTANTSPRTSVSELSAALDDLSLQGAVGGGANNSCENMQTIAGRVSAEMAHMAGSGMEKYCAIRRDILHSGLKVEQFITDFFKPSAPPAPNKKASDYVAILHLWAQSEMHLAHNPQLNLAVHNIAKSHQNYIKRAVTEIAYCRGIPEASIPQQPSLDDLKNLWHLPVQTALHNWQLFDLQKEALQPKTMYGGMYDQFDPAFTPSENQYRNFFSQIVPQLQELILELAQSRGDAARLTSKKQEIERSITQRCQLARDSIAEPYIKDYVIRSEKLILNNLEVFYQHLQKNQTHTSVNIPAEIKSITQRHEQMGATCKISTLFTIHSHFYPSGSKLHIPYFKLGNSTATTSLRQKAKQQGSLQGEILSASQFAAVASACGIEAQKQSFNNYEEFRASIITALEAGNPVAIAYNATPSAAYCSSGEINMPFYSTDAFVRQHERYEHGAVITDYDPATDRFKLVTQTVAARPHGQPNNEILCHSYQLYLSNLSLAATRHRETYLKLPVRLRNRGQIIIPATHPIRPIIIPDKYKDTANYSLGDSAPHSTTVETSDAQGSGFQGCFFICKPKPAAGEQEPPQSAP
ncbi:MAG: hypothetical protein ACRC9T_01735 [Vibrionaceae bacterium]